MDGMAFQQECTSSDLLVQINLVTYIWKALSILYISMQTSTLLEVSLLKEDVILDLSAKSEVYD